MNSSWWETYSILPSSINCACCSFNIIWVKINRLSIRRFQSVYFEKCLNKRGLGRSFILWANYYFIIFWEKGSGQFTISFSTAAKGALWICWIAHFQSRANFSDCDLASQFGRCLTELGQYSMDHWSDVKHTEGKKVNKCSSWCTSVSECVRCIDCHLNIWIFVIIDWDAKANTEYNCSSKSESVSDARLRRLWLLPVGFRGPSHLTFPIIRFSHNTSYQLMSFTFL